MVIIPDGGADEPIAELNGRTPFEAAATPNLDRLALMGRLGTVATTPPGFEPGSDVCSMSLLGYDPRVYHTGRAPLEAAASGVSLGPSDWVFRMNLVTVGQEGTPAGGLMLDHSAGAITDAEARALLEDLAQHWRWREPELAATFEVRPGVSYRNLLVDRSGRAYEHVATTPPHEIPRQPWREALPRRMGGGRCAEADVLRRLMELSAEFLPTHEVNRARVEQGLRPANMVWLWGQGTRPAIEPFERRYGLRGAMITPVDLLAGLAAYLGWRRIPVPGMTSYHDTDYAAQGRATCQAIQDYDIVCCHIEAPDEASHQGDWQTKVASLEAIDRHIIGPVLETLAGYGNPEEQAGMPGWRVLVAPDHFTLVRTRRHDAAPVPFAMAGAWVRAIVKRTFSERHAVQADLHVAQGHELMEYFLHGGLGGGRSR